MNTQSNNSSIILGLFGLASLVWVYFVSPEIVGTITREDGPIENLTALFFAGGAIACLVALFRRQTMLIAAVWAVLCVFFLGEEVSWFQRVFDYSVPFVEQNSTQTEFNFHNLNILNIGRVLQEDGSVEISAMSMLSSQNLFRLGFLFYFLGVPVATFAPFFKKLLARLGYQRPSLPFLAAVWSVIFLSFVLTVITVPPVKDYVAEMREVYYAAVIFLYTLSLLAGSMIDKSSDLGRKHDAHSSSSSAHPDQNLEAHGA